MMFFETCLETDAQVLTQVLRQWLHRRNRRESVKCLMNPMTVAEWTKSWGFVGDVRTKTADQSTVKRAKSVLKTSIPTDHGRGRAHVCHSADVHRWETWHQTHGEVEGATAADTGSVDAVVAGGSLDVQAEAEAIEKALDSTLSHGVVEDLFFVYFFNSDCAYR